MLKDNGIIPGVSVESSREVPREGRETQTEKAIEVVKSL
jgi:hypothetical protein